MKLFIAYVRQRRGEILAFFLFGAIFAGCFLLYRLPVKAVLYPAFLCALFGGAFLFLDYLRVRRRHEQLCRLKGQPAAMIGSLPAAAGIAEEDYRELVMELKSGTERMQADAAARYRDMEEYYTIWVHQIKTPITSMRLSLEKEDTPLSRKLSSDLLRVGQYVEMVLAFLRLGSDSSDYVFKEYDLDAVIGASVAKFASEFIDRRLRLDYTPVNKRIVTDEKWLSFVIEQVLSNALKYTREGGIRIYLREPETLCIEDTGIGIAPNDLPRVFERGYTGCNGRVDKRASGIGLYLCRQICGRLGAEIAIASEPGKGTCVSIGLEQYAWKRE